MQKSPSAFRTISEVADTLGVQTHVLRFWESKFSQIKPVKRSGGRRYYRREDVALIRGIQHYLHEEGMTIKGTQKLVRETGIKAVADLGTKLLGEQAPVEQTQIMQETVMEKPAQPKEPAKSDLSSLVKALSELRARMAAPIQE